MKLDFQFPITGLNGNPLQEGGKDLHANKFLAGLLANATKGDALKFWHWATSLNVGEAINLDPSDVRTLREFIEGHDGLTVLAKAQLLLHFDNAK